MDRRNAIIAVLGAAVLLLAGLLVLERGWLAWRPSIPADQQAVSVVDVALDRKGRLYLDIFFDRPIGRKRVGGTPVSDPATIQPRIGGVWRWQGDNILRFQSTDRFTPATRYTIDLIPERLVGEGQVWVGDVRFEVVTDAFQVDRVDVHEEPLPDGAGRVRLRGTIYFNYSVQPRELAPRLTLHDPEGPEAEIAVALETSWATRSIGFAVESVEKGREERTLELVIARELTPAQGNVSLPDRFVHTIVLGSRDSLVVRTVTAEPGEAESTLRVELSSPVEPQAAVDYVRVEPSVEFRLARDRNALLLRGAFDPGGTYTLMVGAGLRAMDNSVLGEEHAEKVQLSDLPAEVDFQSRGMFLSARGARRILIESVNVPRVELTVERVYRNNVLHLLESARYLVWNERPGYGGLGRVYGDRIGGDTFEFDGPRNRTQVTPIVLDDYLGDAEPGLYRVVVGPKGTPYERRQRWVLITDLGLVAKTSGEDVLAWVSSFADLSPVDGARIRVVSTQNQVLASGTTDARGLAHLRGLGQSLGGKQIGMVVAERAGDWSFLPAAQTVVDTAGLDVSGASGSGSAYDAFLYGERDLYRPGETLRGVVVLRDREIRAPPPMPLLLRHLDPAGAEREELRIGADPSGVASFELDIPSYERTGAHTLELRIADAVSGQYRYHVEEFIPDRIKVEIEPPGKEPSPGELLRFDVMSAYLFGPPAAGLPVEARVRLEVASFAPASFQGFVFENSDRNFPGREILREEAELDAGGQGRFEVEVPGALRVPSSLTAVLTARVQEQGGRGVTARSRVPVHPYPYYVGLRRVGEGYAEPGASEPFEYVAVAPDGNEVAAGPLRAELFHDRWQTVLRRTPSGTYKYESKRDPELVETRAVPGGAAHGRFEFSVPDYGSYRVVVTDPTSGASTQVRFYASGWGYVPWALEDPGRIELGLDREEYVPGQNAEVQVRAPFPGRLLLTVEGERVFHVSLHALSGNTATITVPVRGTYRPNAYITATVIRSARDLQPDSVARAFGAVPLTVDREAHRMRVDLDVPKELRPGRELPVSVRAEPNAQVTIAAVDEGILQLIAQPTPDPFEHFYRKRALGVRTHDIFGLLFPELALGAAPGGGRALEKQSEFVRTEGIRRVEPVALWSGVVQTDARGEKNVRFDVPEFQGALRVMAVAHRSANFGSTQAFVRIRDPIVLLPTFPRFLSFHETLRLPVTVRNDTGTDGEFGVELSSSGPVSLRGEEEQSVAIENGRERTVYFELATGTGADPIELALTASGNGESSRASAHLGTLRPDLPPVTLTRSGAIEEPRLELGVEGEDGLRPEGRRRTLRISRFPLVAYAGRLSSLARYPYGCLEQVTSAAFPLVYLDTLARELQPELFDDRDPRSQVAGAIGRVQAHQLPEGGFVLWPRGTAADLWASLYATHFLVEAERAGHAVSRSVLERALDFVAGEVPTRGSPSRDALQRAAYALYVLTRGGRPDVASMDFLRKQHVERMRPSSRALVAAAYAGAGHTEAVDELVAGIDLDEKIARQTGGNYGSPLRDRALVLLALLEAAPEDPRIGRLAARIGRDAALPGAWTTQETSFALLALGELFKRQAERPPYAGAVRVAGRDVARFDTGTLVLGELPEGVVEVAMDPGYAAGSAFFSLEVRGVPTDEAFVPTSEGLEIERSMTLRGGGAVEGEVEQGDLIRVRFRVRATQSPLQNVVIQNLLPAGLEVENPRLATTEADRVQATHLDVRDDRVLVFLDLGDRKWHSYDALLRAVAPGLFRLPPVQAEAMYDPQVRATGKRGELEVRVRQ